LARRSGQSAAWVSIARQASRAGKTSSPATCPILRRPTGGGGPGWSGYCVTLPWEIYHRYGDRRILEQNFDTIQRWLASSRPRPVTISCGAGRRVDFLGDWLWPGAEGVNGDTRRPLLQQLLLDLQPPHRANIAAALGKADQARAWRQRADSVRSVVHREFFNPGDSSYANGFQAYLSIALLVGVTPESLRLQSGNDSKTRSVSCGKAIFGWHHRRLIHRQKPDRRQPAGSHVRDGPPDRYPAGPTCCDKGPPPSGGLEGKLSAATAPTCMSGLVRRGLGGIRPGPTARATAISCSVRAFGLTHQSSGWTANSIRRRAASAVHGNGSIRPGCFASMFPQHTATALLPASKLRN